MWLATFRVAERVATDHPLNALRRELRLHRLCDEIALDLFSETEVARFIAQTSPSRASDEAFVGALRERTDDVPLLVLRRHYLHYVCQRKARNDLRPRSVARAKF